MDQFLATTVVVVAGLLTSVRATADSNVESSNGERVAAASVVNRELALRAYAGSGSAGPVRRTVDPYDDVERLLLLTPGGPIIVEVRIALDGKPFRVFRETLVDELLAEADTNGDGKPTWNEAAENSRFGFELLGNGSQQRQSTFANYDLNKDGSIDRYEARVVLARISGGATFVAMNPYSTSPPVVKSLLDTDKDGAFSADELAAAPERLKRLDADDNDLLDPAEVALAAPQAGSRAMGVRSAGPWPLPVFVLGPTADWPAVDRELRRRYARSDDGKLTAKCFPLFPKLFERIDANYNREWEAAETDRLKAVAPQIAFEVQLSQTDDEVESSVRVTSLAPELGNQQVLKAGAGGQQTLLLPGARVMLAAWAGSPYARNNERYAASLLSRFDADKNGYLERKEFEENDNPDAQQYVAQFAVWDADGDGKVFPQDTSSVQVQHVRPKQSQVTLFASEHRPSLFRTLDVDGDSRLGLREMQTAARRLKSFDENRDGRIDLEEMPTSITLNFGGGSMRTTYQAGGGGGQTTFTPRGPKWFIHMDRNGDGDVTPKEFLGTPEKFKELDTNGDGFIEPREAEAADAQPDR